MSDRQLEGSLTTILDRPLVGNIWDQSLGLDIQSVELPSLIDEYHAACRLILNTHDR
jgi:hypothetical protein